VSKYSSEETKRIVGALNLLREKGFPVIPEIFDAWCGACITIPIELSVLRRNTDGEHEVLMIHREDKFFNGWHIPGTVMLPGDTEEKALMRLIEREVRAETSKPCFIDRNHVEKKENPRGQEVSLLFVCFLKGLYTGRGKFFSLLSPPEDTLVHHKHILERISRWWNEAQP